MLGLGIDIGTSGVRSAIIKADGVVISTAQVPHIDQSDDAIDARLWWQAVHNCLKAQVDALCGTGQDPAEITDLACCGTSGTMVLVDAALEPVTPALMYNSAGFKTEAARIARHAPEGSIARGSNSALARLLRLQSHDPDGIADHVLHQADYILACLAGRSLGSDDNNVLKLGFDPESQSWPDWYGAAGVSESLLPKVARPGQTLGLIGGALADAIGLPHSLKLHAGTTDSIAAFIASGAKETGDAVTSLGSTLAIKLLSDRRVDDAACGIYSHRLHGRWLAGGASNTGGAVLARYFSGSELNRLSALMDPVQETGLNYYPLVAPGERFPINDPDLPPRLTPRPDRPETFLQGMLEAMARIEGAGYDRLNELGAPAPKRIFTCGGGGANPVWTTIRQARLRTPILPARSNEASVGAAQLALAARA